MKRFNQSWLLDKTNYQVYWGFANIKGKQGKAAEAIELFNMAKTYKPDHTNFYISSASAYSNLFQQNQDTTLLQLMINDLDRAIQLDPKNARAYAELAATYHFKNNKVKALENFKLAEKIDPSVVNPQLRNALTN